MLDINARYGGKVRVRVCGLCLENERILLATHRGLGATGTLLIPPGGGIEPGESMQEALAREFMEETGLEVSVGQFCFIHEYIKEPLHAIELFFSVTPTGGQLKTGNDPEYTDQDQIITDVSYYGKEELGRMDSRKLHGMLQYCMDPVALKQLRGCFNFRDISLK